MAAEEGVYATAGGGSAVGASHLVYEIRNGGHRPSAVDAVPYGGYNGLYYRFSVRT